jgi:hypothetical protein
VREKNTVDGEADGRTRSGSFLRRACGNRVSSNNDVPSRTFQARVTIIVRLECGKPIMLSRQLATSIGPCALDSQGVTRQVQNVGPIDRISAQYV